jgi:hypothetical protein
MLATRGRLMNRNSLRVPDGKRDRAARGSFPEWPESKLFLISLKAEDLINLTAWSTYFFSILVEPRRRN